MARDTVRLWLQQAAPLSGQGATAAQAEGTARAAPTPRLPPPPAPWTDWEEVRQVRQALGACRFLFLRRPDHLTAEQQAELDALLASPVGADLQLARSFLLEWYGLWRDSNGERRSWEEAQRRYRAWRETRAYEQLEPLKKVQAAVDDAQFERLSHFLRDAAWEATSNGAERMGRAFRHRQAPHFCLRTEQAIEDALVLGAFERKEQATAPRRERLHRCQRGRHRREPAQAGLPAEARITPQKCPPLVSV